MSEAYYAAAMVDRLRPMVLEQAEQLRRLSERQEGGMDQVAKCFKKAMELVEEQCHALTHGERMPLVMELTKLMLAQEKK